MRPIFINPIHQTYMRRGLQIASIFTLTVFIEKWIQYPYAAYTGFVVMMIYIGFDVGTVSFRGWDRFLGTISGCLAGFIYWYMGHLNYRSVFALIVCCIFCYIYFVSYTYRTNTFFTISLSLIGTGYLDLQGNVQATEMLIHIFINTVVAYFIIILCETYIFRKNSLSVQIFQHLQKQFIENIRQCENELNLKAHVGLVWNHKYEKVIEELNYLKTYILMNETLLIQVIPKNELEEFIRLAEDYYLGLSLKVCLRRRNDLNKKQTALPYLEMLDLIKRRAYGL